VRPGGIVAYATCSPHLAETRDVVASVGVEPESVTQLWPHLDGTDAMFCALLRKP
jgi:16S rRNA (cytosine967-C5)-methyltransferase